MERQTVIDNIETVAANIEKITLFVGIIRGFTSEPRTKADIRKFCEKYVLDVFLEASDLKSLYSRMTIEPTRANCIELVCVTCEESTLRSDTLIRTFKRNMDRTIDSVLLLISETVEQLNKENTPDLANKIITLNKSLSVMKTIFKAPRDVAVNIDDFATLIASCEDDDKGQNFDEVVKDIQAYFKELSVSVCNRSLLSLNSKDVFDSHRYLCCNNWLSLKNFVLYLDNIL